MTIDLPPFQRAQRWWTWAIGAVSLARLEGADRLAGAPGHTAVEMDSNTVERSIRPLALTRENALFAGFDRAGRTGTAIASLVEGCKLNGVDPQTYLCNVISRIVGGIPGRVPWSDVAPREWCSSAGALTPRRAPSTAL